MNSAKINTLNFFRLFALAILASLLITFFLQLNFPSFQETRNSLISLWLDRQLRLAGEDNRDDLVQLGWSYYQLGHFTKAKSLMEKAYADENSISALYCLGLIDLKYQKLDDAIAKLERVLAFSPDHVPILLSLGESYFKQRYYGRSKVLFEKAVMYEPTSTAARLWLGRTYINLNETAKARQVLGTVNSGPEAREAAALVKNI